MRLSAPQDENLSELVRIPCLGGYRVVVVEAGVPSALHEGNRGGDYYQLLRSHKESVKVLWIKPAAGLGWIRLIHGPEGFADEHPASQRGW